MPVNAVDLVQKRLYPLFSRELDRLNVIDRWYHWDHDKPHQPQAATSSTAEYRELANRSEAPWGTLIVTSVAQNLYVDGYRRGDEQDDAPQWNIWRANGMKRRQIPVHRDALAYGISYVSVLPGKNELTGDDQPVLRGHSPRRMITVYRDPAADEWPLYALSAKANSRGGWDLRVYDDQSIYDLTCDSIGRNVVLTGTSEHGVGVCPVIRFCNQLDNEGRAPGEIEPFIPILGRIDQTAFDRLVVQRFAAWVVRTISGMAKPEGMSDQDWADFKARKKMALTVDSILVAEDADTKFGSLPATSLDGFIKAHEADLRQLAAVSQTPAHEMLGQMANLSAEALAAARASLTAKVEERKYSFGESWDQTMRLSAWIDGDEKGASDFEAEVRWRDTEIRSLSQAADALGKIATQLGVPPEILWEKIPGMTQQDVERMKALADQGAGEEIMALLTAAQTTATDEPAIAAA